MKFKVPESEVLRSCIDLLTIYEARHELYFYRQNNIPVSEVRGRQRVFRAMPRGAKKGVSDILLLLPGSFGCKTIFLECKSSIGKQSEHQKEFQKRVGLIGAEYWLVNSVIQLQQFLKGKGIG